ncbi:zinc metallochaperone AztD [Rhizobium sp. 32-5/1]|uniref:zinc metallochaperone AztD n=1 Tax=Rhizobium sp. 32-5/1 TaxID=3019602 RepID=UPI00240D10E9|nr:zinc metallochaperone AztD [Rhizobium sp. 32-5/1]WEZ84020.1 zinc metallochaperone AztD [Rhizobium sp. 32-5/1]
MSIHLGKPIRVAAIAAATVLSPLTTYAEEGKETWRLFVADHTKPVVRALDAKTGSELGRFDVTGYAALTASDTGRTVFAVQGDKDTVHVLSTGIALADHGEHRDIDVSEPKLLPGAITGQKPGHVVTHDDDIVVFYDRGGKADLFSESVLIDGRRDAGSIDTTAPHHGVAVPMGKNLLVSVPNMEATAKPDELPPRLGLRAVDRQGKQLGGIAPCTGLHGEAASARLVAFGCEEGVLIVRPGGIDGPKFEMLPYGKDLPSGKVSTLLGGKAMQFFLGNYGEDKLVLIDPDGPSPYRLVELETRRVDFALDPINPRNAYVITEDGKLHVLDVVSGEITRSAIVTEPYSKDGHWRDPRPRLAVAGDRIAITDPRHGLVRMVDPQSLKETSTIPVEGQPFSIVAVGGSGATH